VPQEANTKNRNAANPTRTDDLMIPPRECSVLTPVISPATKQE